MTAWRRNHLGLLVPMVAKPTHPRPVGWDKLPADIRAEWDKRWAAVNARQVAA